MKLAYFYNEKFFTPSLADSPLFVWIVPVLVYLVFQRSPGDKVKIRVAISAGVSLLTEYISTNEAIKDDFMRGGNSPIYHIGTPLFMLCLIWIFSDALLKFMSKTLLRAIQTTTVLFCVWNAVSGDGFYYFPNTTVAIYSILGILLPIVYLYQLLQSMTVTRLDKDPLFIAAAGMLVYYSGNFLLWLFLTYINSNYETFRSIYRVNSVLTVLLNIFFVIAILTDTKTTKNTQPVNS